MTAYLYNAPAGIPGNVTRIDDSTVETAYIDSNPSFAPELVGDAVVMDGGRLRRFPAGGTGDSVYGVITGSIRETSVVQNSFGTYIPNPENLQGVLVKGYINVKCKYGTPVRGEPVYIRNVAAGTRLVGDFEAISEPGLNEIIPDVTWAVDGIDADYTAEIRFKI